MGRDHDHGHGEHAHAHDHDHHHNHDHDHEKEHSHGFFGHSHAHDVESALGWALWLNFGFLIIETIVGFWSGSIAVLSDAGHMVADVAALAIAFFAQRFSRVKGGDRYTFGYRRLPILGGLANALTLNAIVVLIVIAAIARFRSPVAIEGAPVLITGILGLGVNLAGAAILYKKGGKSVNVRGALMHLIADALGSVGVMISGVVLATTSFTLIDPIISIFIGGLIALGTYPLLRDLLRTLLLGSPAQVDVEQVKTVFTGDAKVLCLEDFHLWELDADYVVLSARVHARVESLGDADALRKRISGRLKREFRIDHVTIEVGPHPEGEDHGHNDCLGVLSSS